MLQIKKYNLILLRIAAILLLQICIFAFSSNSQSDIKVDSLQRLLAIQENDSNKVIILLELIKEYRNSDIEQAKKYSDIAYELSTRLNYIPGKIDVLYEKCYIHTYEGLFDSAIYINNIAIQLSDSINDIKRLGYNYNLYGMILRKQGFLSTALDFHNKALSLLMEVDDKTGIAISFNSVGIIYYQRADYDSAVSCYLNLIKLSEAIGYEQALASGAINLGKVYLKIGEYNKAKSNFFKSIEINKKYNNIRQIGLAFNNLGMVAFKEEKYDEAIKYFKKGIEYYEKINNKIGLGFINSNIGALYTAKGNYSKALEVYKIAKDYFKETGSKEGILSVLINEAVIFERLKIFTKALAIYDTCLTIAKEIEAKDNLLIVYNNIYKTYEILGNYKKAFKYQNKYIELKDTIFNIEKSGIIADLELKYEKEKNEARILALENENLQQDLNLRKKTNQRNIYLAGGSALVVIVLLLFVFYRHKARKDKIIAEQKIRQLEEEKKLRAARSIVEGQEEERKRIAKELHDGLGVLLSTAKMHFTTISDKSPENKDLIHRATKLLEQASGDVRKISHNMMPGILTKFGLNEALEDLFEQLDESPGLTAEIQISGDRERLPENTEIMLYRIVQEMVNNTLKHAKATNISFTINYLSEQLNIQYSDNGKGFIVNEKLQSKSIGLTSIQSRIDFLSGNLSIESSPGKGTVYLIQIPLTGN